MSEFFCEKCKYLFEKNAPAFKADGMPNYTTECPKCNGGSELYYGPSASIKTHPSNSVDMIVGKEAEKRWRQYDERKSKKEKIRKETGNVAVAVDIQKKSKNDKINYEYKSVSKERIQERKEVIAEYIKSEKDRK